MLVAKNQIKTFLFFLLALMVVMLTSPETTIAEWTKYEHNPVIGPGPPGSWEDKNINAPSVIFDGDIYKMWYGASCYHMSGSRIGYAVSSNGIDWERPLDHPVLDIDASIEIAIGEPAVIFDEEENKYKMWYTSVRSGSPSFQIGYAASPDGVIWVKHPTPVLQASEAWETQGVSSPDVLKIGDEYKMWYSARDYGGRWRIGLSVSNDGINWSKHPGNPVLSPQLSWEGSTVAQADLLYLDGQYLMWYHAGPIVPHAIGRAISPNGISWTKPLDKNPVLTRGTGGSFDSAHISTPCVIKQNNLYKMWYGGYDGSHKSIGYAYEEVAPPPLQPIVLLPGLGASWNHENMVLGIEKPAIEWYMIPGGKSYDGLIQTLKNAGYETEGEDKNLFFFNYNWTKPVGLIANELGDYINSVVTPPGEIDLIGHSLGGLVARTYVQNNPANSVDQLVTVGSPHQGAVQAYYAWEGGDLYQSLPAWARIGAGLLLHLRNPFFPTPKEAIHSVIPSLKDLLPTFDYLKQNGSEIPIGEMVEKNNWLIVLNGSPPSFLLSVLKTIVGVIPENTLRWIWVTERGWLSRALNLWPDGQPTGEEEFANGDNTILVQSAQLAGAEGFELGNLNHRDLIETEEGQTKIVEILGLSPTSISTISTGIAYEPALVFQIASPATIEVFDSVNNPVGEGDGKMVVVTNAVSGEYQVKLMGTANDDYHLHIGQITPEEDIWSTLSGSIGEGEEIVHKINFQLESPLENPLVDPDGEKNLASAITKLEKLRQEVQQQPLNPFLKRTLLFRINRIFRLINRGRIEEAIISLYRLRVEISSFQKMNFLGAEKARFLKNLIQEVIDNLERVYIITKNNQGGTYPELKLGWEIRAAKGYFRSMEEKFKRLANQGQANLDHGILYLLAQKKLNLAQSATSFAAHIYALGVRYLSREGLVY